MAGGDRWTHGTDTRAPYVLTALFAFASLVLLWSTLYVAVEGEATWLFAVPPVALLLLWPFLHWNRGASPGRKAVSLLFMSAAFAGVAAGSGVSSIPLIAVTIVHAVCVFGAPGGAGFSAVLVAGSFAGGLLVRGADRAGWTVAETVVIAAFAVLALVTARTLLDARQRARETERLLGELSEAHAELGRYAARVRELTVAEERARMSREMHDSVGHYLTVINLGLENAQRYRETRPDDGWAEVRQAQRLTMEALADTRRWVRALKPLALEGRAGPAAMAELARSFEGTGIEVTFRAVGAGFALGEESELALYRTLQEGLTNAARHSGGRKVEVVLASSHDGVTLSITDDGRAAPAPDGGGGEGRGQGVVGGERGLAGLRHRIGALGGTLTAGAAPGGGFVLRASLPTRAEVGV
ncbi:sensor histidine kinase [Nonomuraea mesophila]|uniref:histidine kinase n=1 Tax=Nonomuraea mesophila TaxID=2530382 RepID=A0A4V6PGB4_9ACTN|nr:sensor histidine kinase [Nonomuraea mesophila]TDE41708.1 sensor histidine kinase [Nonomuraea mesophila]